MASSINKTGSHPTILENTLDNIKYKMGSIHLLSFWYLKEFTSHVSET
jgi:hypothetical protein